MNGYALPWYQNEYKVGDKDQKTVKDYINKAGDTFSMNDSPGQYSGTIVNFTTWLVGVDKAQRNAYFIGGIGWTFNGGTEEQLPGNGMGTIVLGDWLQGSPPLPVFDSTLKGMQNSGKLSMHVAPTKLTVIS